jgi:hypothetical protein
MLAKLQAAATVCAVWKVSVTGAGWQESHHFFHCLPKLGKDQPVAAAFKILCITN